MPSLGKDARQLDVKKALAGIESRTGLRLRTAQFAYAGVSGQRAGATTPRGWRRRVSIGTIARLAGAADLPIIEVLKGGKRRR